MTSRDSEPQATLRSRRPGRAGFPPSARHLALCAVAVATALAAAAAAQSAPQQRRLQSPRRAEISRAAAPIHDSTLAARSFGLLTPGTYWGGAYKTASGESVTVYASNVYPVDSAVGQRWADFLASLVHGSELSSIIVFLAPGALIARVCGQDAVACYSPRESTLVTPGDDPAGNLSAEAVITHEYGHHVAVHRSNAPWPAADWGPKRWASSMQVCAAARRGDLVPGAEDPVQYTENPGEGWAETYRVLNERKTGRAETPWQIVTQALYPTAGALAAAEQDVTSPWEHGTTTTQIGAVTRTSRTRTYRIPTQLDGALKVTLRSSAGLRLKLELFASSTRVRQGVAAGVISLSTTVCGARSHRIRVSAVSGSGSFSLTVAKP